MVNHNHKSWLLAVIAFTLLDITFCRSFVEPHGRPFSVKSTSMKQTTITTVQNLPRGGGWVPAGWNPLGYKLTALGDEFLSYQGSTDGDIGRFLSTLKTRKRFADLKANWLEIVRVAKSAQSMRIYKKLEEMIAFCLKAGLID